MSLTTANTIVTRALHNSINQLVDSIRRRKTSSAAPIEVIFTHIIVNQDGRSPETMAVDHSTDTSKLIRSSISIQLHQQIEQTDQRI